MATTIELRDRVLAHQFSSARYGDLILIYLNEGQKKFVREVKSRIFVKDYDFATSANDNSYTLPSDFSEFIGLYDQDNDTLLRPMDARVFESTEISSGTSDHYTIIADTLYLTPQPDAIVNLRLRYQRQPTDISASVNPEIHADYHDYLEHYGIWRCYIAEHDYEAAEYHKGLWETLLNEAKGQLHADTLERPRQIPGMWS